MVTLPGGPRGKPGMLAIPIPEAEFSSTARTEYIQKELGRTSVETLDVFAIVIQGGVLFKSDFVSRGMCLPGVGARASRTAFETAKRSELTKLRWHHCVTSLHIVLQPTCAQYVSQQRTGRGVFPLVQCPLQAGDTRTPQALLNARRKNLGNHSVSAIARSA